MNKFNLENERKVNNEIISEFAVIKILRSAYNKLFETFWLIGKDAGFDYELIRIEYFDIFGLTNRIHDTNLMKPGLQNESTIQIFWMPCAFAESEAQDSYGFILVQSTSMY